MKTILITLTLLILISLHSIAQQKVNTKYCEIESHETGFSGKNKRVELYLGEVDSLFALKDTSQLSRLKLVTTLRTNPDILHYMINQGWSLLTILKTVGTTTFYFKKDYYSSELVKTKK